jgi:hypothetical protein
MSKVFGWFIGLSLLASSSLAAGGLVFNIDQTYNSVRALGMGGAMAAVADDYNTLFYNPAGMTRLSEGEFNGFLRGGFEPSIIELLNEISKAGSDEAALNAAIAKFYSQNMYTQPLSLGGFWVRPNWGVAFIPIDMDANISVHQGLGPTLNLKTLTHTTFAMGFAQKQDWSWLPGNVSVGGTGKMILKGSVEKAVPAVDLATNPEVFTSKDLAMGATVDVDASVMWTPEWKVDAGQPHFSVVGRNLLNWGFQNVGDASLGTPSALQRRFDLGSAWEFPTFSFFSPLVVFDIRDIGHTNWNVKKGIHLGAELKWDAWGWLNGAYRLGINQGYWTAGINLQAAWFGLDIISWGEEMGTSSVGVESRRFMVQFNLNI